MERAVHDGIVRRSAEEVAPSPDGRLSSDRVDPGCRNAKTPLMLSTTCIAALLLHLACTAPSHVVPPEALGETAQAHPLSTPPPGWSAQALAEWPGPWILRPGLYDHRYITW